VKEAIEYLIDTLDSDLGLTPEEAIEVLAHTIVTLAKSASREESYDLLEKANEIIATA
jgi:hypothetical protein